MRIVMNLVFALALLSSCETLGDSLTTMTSVRVDFSGTETSLSYAVQKIVPYEDARKKTQEENAILQLAQYDELVNLPMRESTEVPATRTFTTEDKSDLYLKIDTSKLTGDLTLRIDRTRVVLIRKNNPLGYQIVKIY